MGDLRIFNSAGIDDVAETVTTTGTTYGRVVDLFATKQSVENIVDGAPEDLDTLLEISEELDDAAYQEFLTALNGG